MRLGESSLVCEEAMTLRECPEPSRGRQILILHLLAGSAATVLKTWPL